MEKTEEKKSKGGRPKKKIDYEIVFRLANIFCTKTEIACVLGFDPSTLYADPVFQDTYKRGREGGKTTLRRYQMNLAEKNTAMAVWLGKQYLGQKDLPTDESSPRVLVVADVPTDDNGDNLPLDSTARVTNEISNDNEVITIDDGNIVDIEKTADNLGIDLETLNDKR